MSEHCPRCKSSDPEWRGISRSGDGLCQHAFHAPVAPSRSAAAPTIDEAVKLIEKMEACEGMPAKLILLRNFVGKQASAAPPFKDWAEKWAKDFHDTYERSAPAFGYETRKESAKPWADVPENNRKLMIAVCAEVLCRFEKERTALYPEASAAPPSEREAAIREALKIHWLSQIECNHYEKNDSAICACGWKSDRGFNVGKAVEFWIDHVFAQARAAAPQVAPDEEVLKALRGAQDTIQATIGRMKFHQLSYEELGLEYQYIGAAIRKLEARAAAVPAPGADHHVSDADYEALNEAADHLDLAWTDDPLERKAGERLSARLRRESMAGATAPPKEG